jgi:hypothetical protein
MCSIEGQTSPAANSRTGESCTVVRLDEGALDLGVTDPPADG